MTFVKTYISKDGKVIGGYIDTIEHNNERNIRFVNKMEEKQYFIGVKMIAAIAMTYGVAHARGLTKQRSTPLYEDEEQREGYLVDYGDYQSWSPKDVFEAAYFPIQNPTKISRADVEAFIVPGEPMKLGKKTTIVLDTTLTGFDTIATSACVDPNNFNLEIGAEIARKDITDKIWGHLGFVLQWAKNGLKSKADS